MKKARATIQISLVKASKYQLEQTSEELTSTRSKIQNCSRNLFPKNKNRSSLKSQRNNRSPCQNPRVKQLERLALRIKEAQEINRGSSGTAIRIRKKVLNISRM
jgi:hypothetical protein